MSTPDPLFDTSLVRRHLARAVARGYAGFLLERAAEDLNDRLAAVLRDFRRILDLSSPIAAAEPVLARRFPESERFRLSPQVEGGENRVVGDAEWVPIRQASIDLVVSLLALQAVNDLPGVLVQVRRSLRPDGLFVGCLLGGATLTELRQCLTQAESELEGGLSPRVAPFFAIREAGGLLQRAGFALPVVDSDLLTVRYSDAFALMRDLRAMGMTNALSDRRKSPTRRTTLLRAAQIYSERFADSDGRIRASFEIVWLSGWAPHESQQKPLRPGSAKTRLADALGTVELKGEST